MTFQQRNTHDYTRGGKANVVESEKYACGYGFIHFLFSYAEQVIICFLSSIPDCYQEIRFFSWDFFHVALNLIYPNCPAITSLFLLF